MLTVEEVDPKLVPHVPLVPYQTAFLARDASLAQATSRTWVVSRGLIALAPCSTSSNRYLEHP